MGEFSEALYLFYRLIDLVSLLDVCPLLFRYKPLSYANVVFHCFVFVHLSQLLPCPPLRGRQVTVLCWRDASLNTVDNYCVGGMHLSIHYTVVLEGCISQYIRLFLTEVNLPFCSAHQVIERWFGRFAWPTLNLKPVSF